MAITLAFDVYGTLIDTYGVIAALEKSMSAIKPLNSLVPGARNSLNIQFVAA